MSLSGSILTNHPATVLGDRSTSRRFDLNRYYHVTNNRPYRVDPSKPRATKRRY